MIPDYQTLMRPVLECAAKGEVQVGAVVDQLADQFALSEGERTELLPSGRQTRFANRVHWAKSYLKQAGLIQLTKRGHFVITDLGKMALSDPTRKIDNNYLDEFENFRVFRTRTREPDSSEEDQLNSASSAEQTPDEILRTAHQKIDAALAQDLLDRVRNSPPAFFESLIVQLLLAMGYGGTSDDAGRALGKSGDDGVDGVVDQDPLGVDQIYIQAKRYSDGNNIGAGAIRDFFGALSLKRAHKGIFITTSGFSQSAIQTAKGLGTRIVLIDGLMLSKLMIKYNIGCRDEEVLHLKRIDEDFFE